MSVEIKKLPVSSIVPVQPPGPAGSYYYNIVLPSTTADGYVYYQNVDWATCRAGATGNSSSSTSNPGTIAGIQAAHYAGTSPYYRIWRTFLYFDMSALPAGATVLSGTLRVHTYDDAANSPAINYADSAVVAQEGTQSSELSTADYDAFTGPAFGNVVWKPYNVNYIELNQDGIDYLNSQIGGEGKICLREHTYDYSNPSPPPDANQFSNGVYYREAETYDFGSELYHREYVPFLNLYYQVDWEDTNPGSTTSVKWMYALDGPTSGASYNHDLRIAAMSSGYTTWSGARDGSTANNIQYGDNSWMRVLVQTTSDGAIEYQIYRSYIAFDLAEITDNHEIATAQIRVRSRGYAMEEGDPIPRLDVFQGTWDYTLTTGEYGSFTGSSLLTAQVTWASSDSYTTVSLNQDGLDYLNNNAGKIVYFCLREYDHDVLDVAPAAAYDQLYYGAFYGTGQGADSTYDPALYVTYNK